MPVRTEIIEVPVQVMVEIPPSLTAKPAKPKRPANRCKDERGRATICNRDMADWINAYDALVDKLFGKLDAINGLQSEVAP